MPQTLQAFFDSPPALAARYNLSASAAEPLSLGELLAFEPGTYEQLQDRPLGYPERHGPLRLRELIAARYSGLTAEDILPTSGLDDGLAMLFSALVAPGDRIIVLTPCYPPQLQLPRWRGAEVVPWPARAENGWVPALDELRGLLSPQARLLVATFPQNPTGFTPDEDFARQLLDVVCERGTTLVSDEIYAGLPPLAEGLVTGLAEKDDSVISLHGLSKTCGLPGLRVGWLASRNREAMRAIRQVRNLFNAYLPSPIAAMAEIALRHEAEIVARNTAIVRSNEKAARGFFSRRANHFSWEPPRAGVLSFPRWRGANGATALSQRLLREAGVIFAPSSCFEAGDEHLRLSTARRNFPDALAALDRFLDSAE